MSDSEALLAAVAAAPDEDTPRLMYADWRAEHDDPERAEFIRLQLALSKRSYEDLGYGYAGKEAMTARENALLNNNGERWQREVYTQSSFIKNIWFERGFPHTLVISNERRYLENASQLHALHPIQGLATYEITSDSNIRELVRSPWLGRLRKLDLRGGSWLTDTGVAALLNSPDIVGLTHLTIARSHVTDEGAAQLAATTRLPNLEYLDCSGNQFTSRGTRTIATSSAFPKLTELRLQWCPITPDDATAVAQSPELAKLDALLLDGHSTGDTVRPAVLRAFAQSPHCRDDMTICIGHDGYRPSHQPRYTGAFADYKHWARSGGYSRDPAGPEL